MSHHDRTLRAQAEQYSINLDRKKDGDDWLQELGRMFAQELMELLIEEFLDAEGFYWSFGGVRK